MPKSYNIQNFKTMKPVCGIYAIVGPARRHYIGQGSNVVHRLKDHIKFLRQGKHWNPFLQRTWDKYGAEAFTFKVLCETAPDKDVLTAAEQHWMNHHRTRGGLYNARPAAGSMLGYKHPIGARTGKTPKSETHCKNLSRSKRGKVSSEESKQKTRDALAERKRLGLPVGRPKGPASVAECLQRSQIQTGKKHKKKTKLKMSASRKDYYEKDGNRESWSVTAKAIWAKRRANPDLVNGQRAK